MFFVLMRVETINLHQLPGTSVSKDAATHDQAPILVTFLPLWQTPDRNDLKKNVIWFMDSVGHGGQREHGRIHGGKSLSRSGTKRD